ncbi:MULTISPECIES: hypothetical protein [Neobacillus]|uniref:Uncharacterized protein n=1 Tax=Neobacillus citreus TaxID=2833578 RepID=A0A942YEJ3_9BACI|nr:hypothetical protein [Neobacillus citreus]MCH6265641.1 hypothetical protein [Neobacillus citreus]
MGVWWVTTIGVVICLGLAGGVLVHFLRSALDIEDSTRIDKIDSNNETQFTDKS